MKRISEHETNNLVDLRRIIFAMNFFGFYTKNVHDDL